MAQSNGHDEAAVSARLRNTVFTIGGKDVSVPPLTFWCLEKRDPELKAIGAGTSVAQYSDAVLLIAATSIEAAKAGEDDDPDDAIIDKTFRRLKRKIIFGEMRTLSAKMDELLLNSGYEMTVPGEAEAASRGTETSTDSSQTSSDSESVTPIRSESNVH